MSYDPPTIMDKLHAIARVLGIDEFGSGADSIALNLESLQDSAGMMLSLAEDAIPIAERIAVAPERLADKHAPQTWMTCPLCAETVGDIAKHFDARHPNPQPLPKDPT
jgi:hypothetical protein